MRRLILLGVLSLALPAYAAAESAPMMKATAPEEAAATMQTAEGEGAARTAVPATDVSAPEAEPMVAESEPEQPPVSPEAVARGTFTTAIDQREPVDSITSLGSDRDRVYYFNEFVGISGHRVMHRWEYEGEVVAEVPIAIGGPRWRAYSSKNMDAGRLGEWTVSVVDESGHVVHTDSFEYEAAAPVPEVAATTAEPESTVTKPAVSEAKPEAPAESPAAPAPADAVEESRAGSTTARP